MVNFSQIVESMKGCKLVLINPQQKVRVIGEIGNVSVQGDAVIARVLPEPESIEEDPDYDMVSTDGVVRITFLKTHKVEVVKHEETDSNGPKTEDY